MHPSVKASLRVRTWVSSEAEKMAQPTVEPPEDRRLRTRGEQLSATLGCRCASANS